MVSSFLSAMHTHLPSGCLDLNVLPLVGLVLVMKTRSATLVVTVCEF